MSSGPWKKHKYFQKIGEGANAVYRYTKQAGGKVKNAVDNADHDITGSAYKKEAEDEKRRSEYANELAGTGTKDLKVGRDVDNVKNGPYGQYANFKFTSSQNWADSAQYHGRKAAEAQSNYYNKSLAGKAEKTAKNVVNKAKNKFKTTTTETVTDTFTGKTRAKSKPSSAEDTVSLKAASDEYKKKKKLKHDDLHECVALGEQILDEFFGR